jgi:ribosomal protein S18 acetylase RimI-like enzyme
VAVGYVVITLGYSIEYGGRDGFIDDLYLVPEPALGIGTLHLEVETGNDYASRLYRRAGFEATGRRLLRLRLRS